MACALVFLFPSRGGSALAFRKLILEILDSRTYPVGARMISKELAALSVTISQATVGRMLLEMDSAGLTQNVANKGRLLSPEGASELARMRSLEQENVSLHRLQELLLKMDWGTLIDVQEARLVIEPSLAGFAAYHATRNDLARMDAILCEYDETAKNASDSLEYGDAFHIEVARAAGKPILEAAFNLICPQRKWNTTLLGFIQDKQRGINTISHRDIFNAIVKRDKERACELMKMHLYSVFLSLKEYEAGGG